MPRAAEGTEGQVWGMPRTSFPQLQSSPSQFQSSTSRTVIVQEDGHPLAVCRSRKVVKVRQHARVLCLQYINANTIQDSAL